MEYGVRVELEMYDAVNDVENIFPEDFRKYVQNEKLLCWRPSFFGTDFYVLKKANSPGLTSDSQSPIDSFIGFLQTQFLMRLSFLLQFWAVEEEVVVVNTTVDHTNYRLTTTNQPFLLGAFWLWRLCRYRKKTCDVIVPGDGRGGAIGRVFRNKRIESTPDVGFYSSQEYPLRDVALSCHIQNSIVVPWFDSHGKVVGVIEFVSTQNPDSFVKVLGYFIRYLSSSLGRVDRCQGLCAQVRDGLFKKKRKDSEKALLSSALSEIKGVIGEVFQSRNINLVATWMLCNNCNSLCTYQYCPRLSAFRRGYLNMYNVFKEAKTSCILQKGEGVVGKAAESSHNLVYCENVAKFSIIEYPLAHFARLFDVSACFALCLRSDNTGDQVYILEFFLSPERVRGMDLRAMLAPILDQMKRDFQTFKVAFGREELGDRLPVLVTDANSPDKLETLIGQETSTEDTPVEYVPVASASTVQSEFHVTINAKYGVHFFRFQLSASSGIHELYRQLSQRLGLVDGTYDLKYLDEENDPIELICDDDLQLFITNSVKHEISTLLVLIVPK